MSPSDSPREDTVGTAAKYVQVWDKGDLPAPPPLGWRFAVGLVGPGVVLAGTSIGSGEWLFGPAVSAQYGATLLWLALVSIVLQVFCNLLSMRYAIYCGEPLMVGIMRTWPGPRVWIPFIALLDIAAIFPYNASNAAVPLAAAMLGHLPTADDRLLVKVLGFTVFLVCFIPLIFGGTVYRMLEKVMSFKLVVVLGYLTLVAVFMVSAGAAWDVLVGFVRVGTVPLRPDTLIVGRHFNVKTEVTTEDQLTRYQMQGSWERDGSVTGTLTSVTTMLKPIATRDTDSTKLPSTTKRTFELRSQDFPADIDAVRQRILTQTKPYIRSGDFFLQTQDGDTTLTMEGRVVNHHDWVPTVMTLRDSQSLQKFTKPAAAPEPYATRFQQYLDNEGLALVSLTGYVQEHGKLPPLDWFTIVSFIAIAGAGGLTNSMFSNYARDKGWGMGAHVGAIPSALGGRTIGLSHTGRVFLPEGENYSRWRGWLRHIGLDQSIWFFASVIGMALPCMMSLEFIRNASVTGDRVAAMTAEGMAERFPSYSGIFWFVTLLVGFLVLAPGQVSTGDQISRRWTDILWTTSARVRSFGQGEVRYLYYGLLGTYCVAGLIILALFPALQIAKIASTLQNLALGSSTLLALYIQRTLVPRELRPHWLLQLGGVLCGVFFLCIGLTIVLAF